MSDHRLVRLVLAAALLGGSAASVSAQDAGTAIPVSLADGVRQSLDRARLIQLAREDINLQRAALRQARGAFDGILQIAPLLEHREDAIENTGFFDQERVKRGFANGLHTGFGTIADALAQQISLGRGDLPLCPDDGTNSQFFVTLPGTVLPVPICRPASLSQSPSQLQNLEGGSDNGSFLVRQALPFNPLSSYDLQLLLASAFRVQISTLSLEARERGNELLLNLQTAARITEIKAGLAAERLGVLPEYVYANTASLFGEYTKPLRNGSTFQLDATFDGRATLFRDKPIDPTFGGTSVPNLFTNRLEAAWIQPLLRGRGAVSVRAAERAAEKNVEASRYSFEQTASDQALTTANAYFDLILAQDSLALTRQSLVTQRQMLDNTIRLVGAGDVANVDVSRARARTAEVEGQVATEQLAILSAQQHLADAMGLTLVQAISLTASDTFPATPATLDLDALSQGTLMRRSDLNALLAFRDTSRILLAAARADARWRLDLRVSGGYSQAYSGPTFHSLFDENGVHVTNDDYLTYYGVGGIGRAFKQAWEPFVLVTANFELPFGNNQRLGRVEQAAASSAQSDIQVADLGRSIQNILPRAAEDIRRLRAEWEQRQEVVVQYEATWDTAQRLRATGDMSLIDTLLTEQQLTDARLALVSTKRDYAAAVARFRRETGTLVGFTDPVVPQPNLAGIVTGR